MSAKKSIKKNCDAKKRSRKASLGNPSSKSNKSQRKKIIRTGAVKKTARGFLFGLITVIVLMMGLVAWSGYMPLVSSMFGAKQPRNLGIEYTGADRGNARMKSGVQYGSLAATTPIENSIRRSGTQGIETSFSSAELTALLNDRPYKYWPFEEMQLRIGEDGIIEISGRVNSAKLPLYARGEKISQNLVDGFSLLCPSDAVFYIKGQLGIKENKVNLFKVERFQIGRLPIPVALARILGKNFVKEARLPGLNSSSGAEVIDYWLTGTEGLSIVEGTFKNSQLYLKGTIPSQELTVR